MYKGHVIDFRPDGSVQAMHNDRFDLAFLGRQKVERATEIKFNESTQRWGIWVHRDDHHINFATMSPFNPPVENADGFLSYEKARQVEVSWLNACRLEGCAPESPAGLAALKFIRGTTPE